MSSRDSKNVQTTTGLTNRTDERSSSMVQHAAQRQSRTLATGRRPNGALTGDPTQDERNERRRQSNRRARQKCEAKRKKKREVLEQTEKNLNEQKRLLEAEIDFLEQRKRDLEIEFQLYGAIYGTDSSQSAGISNDIQTTINADSNFGDKQSRLAHDISPTASEQTSNGSTTESIEDIIIEFKYPPAFEKFLQKYSIDAATLFEKYQPHP